MSMKPGNTRITAGPVPTPPHEQGRAQAIQSQVIEVLRTIRDPEMPVSIYEMGLIYGIEVSAAAVVGIRMTLTSPACEVAELLPVEVESRVGGIPAVADVHVELVWDPPWTPERMSEAARLELGF